MARKQACQRCDRASASNEDSKSSSTMNFKDLSVASCPCQAVDEPVTGGVEVFARSSLSNSGGLPSLARAAASSASEGTSIRPRPAGRVAVPDAAAVLLNDEPTSLGLSARMGAQRHRQHRCLRIDAATVSLPPLMAARSASAPVLTGMPLKRRMCAPLPLHRHSVYSSSSSSNGAGSATSNRHHVLAPLPEVSPTDANSCLTTCPLTARDFTSSRVQMATRDEAGSQAAGSRDAPTCSVTSVSSSGDTSDSMSDGALTEQDALITAWSSVLMDFRKVKEEELVVQQSLRTTGVHVHHNHSSSSSSQAAGNNRSLGSSCCASPEPRESQDMHRSWHS